MSLNSIAVDIQNLLATKQVFVFYRKGGEQKGTVVIQKDANLYPVSDYSQSGFVMAAFDTAKLMVLIPYDKATISTFKNPVSTVKKSGIRGLPLTNPKREAHIDLVHKTISFIKEKKARKIVISRCLQYDFDSQKTGEIFQRLLKNYPEAMVYIWHHPKVGLWMGATPEKLVHLSQQEFTTMALAGTQKYQENCLWKAKEKEEQQLVSAYIKQQLAPLSKEIKVSHPYTLKAGHLAHICSDFKGKLAPKHGLSSLLAQLHPTPAVCGTPQEIARDFILKNEGYDRKFYTGFLGELNRNNVSDLYVNLRCMELVKDKAILYIGGGITAASDPEAEYQETQNKANVMGRMLY